MNASQPDKRVAETVSLYRNAFRKTGESLIRGWIAIVAVVGFAFLLLLATQDRKSVV